MFLFCLFFFFKQKTAYEMCISDWSSDVCSSDLLLRRLNIQASCKDRRLIGDDSNRAPLDAPKTTDDVACMGGLHFKEVARSEERRVGKECVSPCRSRW